MTPASAVRGLEEISASMVSKTTRMTAFVFLRVKMLTVLHILWLPADCADNSEGMLEQGSALAQCVTRIC